MSDNRDMKSKMKQATDSAQSSARETMEKATAMIQEMNPMHRGDKYPGMDRDEELALQQHEDMSRDPSGESSSRHKHPFHTDSFQDPHNPMYDTPTEGFPRSHVYKSPLQGSLHDPIYNDPSQESSRDPTYNEPSQLRSENMPYQAHDESDSQRKHKDKMEATESDQACMQQEINKYPSHEQQS